MLPLRSPHASNLYAPAKLWENIIVCEEQMSRLLNKISHCWVSFISESPECGSPNTITTSSSFMPCTSPLVPISSGTLIVYFLFAVLCTCIMPFSNASDCFKISLGSIYPPRNTAATIGYTKQNRMLGLNFHRNALKLMNLGQDKLYGLRYNYVHDARSCFQIHFKD